MIKKTLLIFFTLCLGYTALVSALPGPTPEAKTIWQYNQIRIEDYVFDPAPSPPDVIVGTSLSGFFYLRHEGHVINNLSIIGKSVFEGLEIIRRRGIAPRTVFIEVNMLLNRRDADYVDNMLNPFWITLKRRFPVLRARHNLTNVIYNRLFQRPVKDRYVPRRAQLNAGIAGYEGKQRSMEEFITGENLKT